MEARPRSLLLPAPGRGKYDRALGRARRHAEQQERLLLAAAEAFALVGRSVGLSAVVARARTGRNTFYEYFDDVEHALAAVRARVIARLDGALARALATARTPVERLRVVSRAFFESLSQHPYEAAAGLWRERETDALSPIGRTLSLSYTRAMRSTRALSTGDELRALSVSAAAEAIFSECVLDPLLRSAREREARSEPRDAAKENSAAGAESKAPVDLLVDLAVRVLR
jgi:AcrR family transcriptional regulator